MSNKIPIIGKVWLIFLIILAAAGVVSNLMYASKGIIYIISASACAGELFGVIYLIRGKGINYFYTYSACYLVNAILNVISSSDGKTAPYIIGFILGIVINIGFTYLASKNTFRD